MKRSVFPILTTIALVLIVLIGFLGWAVLHQQSLDTDSSELAIGTARAVLAENDHQALVRRAHPLLLAALPPESLTAYLRSLPRLLGELEEITAISGGASFALWQFRDVPVTASYDLSVRFRYDEARLHIELAQFEGQWLITTFEVDSPLLAN